MVSDPEGLTPSSESFGRSCLASGDCESLAQTLRDFVERFLGRLLGSLALEFVAAPHPDPLPASGERGSARSGSTTSKPMLKSSRRAKSSATFMPLLVVFDETLAHRLRQRQLAQDDAVEGGAVERDGAVGLGSVAVGQIGERAVLQGKGVALAGVGEFPVDDDGLAFGLLAVEAHAEEIEEQVEARGRGRCRRPHARGRSVRRTRRAARARPADRHCARWPTPTDSRAAPGRRRRARGRRGCSARRTRSGSWHRPPGGSRRWRSPRGRERWRLRRRPCRPRFSWRATG